jgi:hypothetical protein
MPELSDFVAVNAASAGECGCDGPVCDCAGQLNPNLSLSCEGGACTGWDVRQSDTYAACSIDADCRLRDGLACCEGCGGESWGLVAIRADAAAALAAEVCAPSQACDACAPVYPSNAAAVCSQGYCSVVFAD